MTTQPITKEEFESIHRRVGRTPSKETNVIQALSPFTGTKMACRWNHTGENHICNGSRVLRKAANRRHFKISTKCHDGTLYVFRFD